MSFPNGINTGSYYHPYFQRDTSPDKKDNSHESVQTTDSSTSTDSLSLTSDVKKQLRKSRPVVFNRSERLKGTPIGTPPGDRLSTDQPFSQPTHISRKDSAVLSATLSPKTIHRDTFLVKDRRDDEPKSESEFDYFSSEDNSDSSEGYSQTELTNSTTSFVPNNQFRATGSNQNSPRNSLENPSEQGPRATHIKKIKEGFVRRDKAEPKDRHTVNFSLFQNQDYRASTSYSPHLRQPSTNQNLPLTLAEHPNDIDLINQDGSAESYTLDQLIPFHESNPQLEKQSAVIEKMQKALEILKSQSGLALAKSAEKLNVLIECNNQLSQYLSTLGPQLSSSNIQHSSPSSDRAAKAYWSDRILKAYLVDLSVYTKLEHFKKETIKIIKEVTQPSSSKKIKGLKIADLLAYRRILMRTRILSLNELDKPVKSESDETADVKKACSLLKKIKDDIYTHLKKKETKEDKLGKAYKNKEDKTQLNKDTLVKVEQKRTLIDTYANQVLFNEIERLTSNLIGDLCINHNDLTVSFEASFLDLLLKRQYSAEFATALHNFLKNLSSGASIAVESSSTRSFELNSNKKTLGKEDFSKIYASFYVYFETLAKNLDCMEVLKGLEPFFKTNKVEGLQKITENMEKIFSHLLMQQTQEADRLLFFLYLFNEKFSTDIGEKINKLYSEKYMESIDDDVISFQQAPSISIKFDQETESVQVKIFLKGYLTCEKDHNQRNKVQLEVYFDADIKNLKEWKSKVQLVIDGELANNSNTNLRGDHRAQLEDLIVQLDLSTFKLEKK